eukprot:TRINITY_DN63123_c0_g1_i2.p1 TRINITY_DN63123_c0_g1~~TRINITY_DN63123_c0_g1_i2.p1  ORF type:complete len:336 (+),score=77.47 TRINITY_DN63123_c0_g1_i2:97-1008(+)
MLRSLVGSEMCIRDRFQVLSKQGVHALARVCELLESVMMHGEDDRASSYIAGAGHRSKFIRDLCKDPSLLAHLSEVAGARLGPYTIPDCQAYVNFAPEDVTEAVDTWHVDSLGFDMVIMVTDPTTVKGGRFEWFHGTATEAAGFLGVPADKLHLGGNGELPAERVRDAGFPGAGWAVLQQGSHVVHRATCMTEYSKRTTVILGFTTGRIDTADPTNVEYMATWGHPGLHAEIARHAAWRASARLAAIQIDPDATAAECAAALCQGIEDAQRAIAALEKAADPTQSKLSQPRVYLGSAMHLNSS